jgi:type IV secretion system protein TrbG
MRVGRGARRSARQSTGEGALRLTLAMLAVAFLAGACTKRLDVAEIPLLDAPAFAAANREDEPKRLVEVVEVARPLPLPGQLKPIPSGAPKNPAQGEPPPKDRIAAANAQARVEPQRRGYINAIQVYPFAKGALYRLYAAVGEVTDIALEEGEKLTSVSAGDTVRWVVGDTTSGEGKAAIVHILVKPIQPDLESNLVITTDRRTYHLEMLSTEKTYMASVSWTYPTSELVSLRKERGEAEAAPVEMSVNPERLRFRYRIEGDAPWKPLSVFDDSAKVYIQFPAGLSEAEAPPLFVVGPDGRPALVNYRMRGTTYIVDRLFAAAELRLGTAPQRVVRIVRTDAVWRKAEP